MAIGGPPPTHTVMGASADRLNLLGTSGRRVTPVPKRIVSAVDRLNRLRAPSRRVTPVPKCIVSAVDRLSLPRPSV